MRNVLTLMIFAGVGGLGSARGDAPAPVIIAPGVGQAINQAQPSLPPDLQAPSFQDCLIGPAEPIAIAGGPSNPGARFWVRGEYLLWWTKGSQLPPLVTSGAPGTNQFPGVLGQAGTNVLYGNSGIDNRVRSGARFSGGFWIDPCGGYGIDGSYFFLASSNNRFDAASDASLGSTLIARPFFDVLTGLQNAQLVAFPALINGTGILAASGGGLASGDIRVSTYSRLQGGDINIFCQLCGGCNYWVQTLYGFRYLNLEEGLAVSETSRVNAALPAGSPFFGGSTIAISDRFDTRNNFYGGQVGLRGEVRRGRAFLEARGTVALGVTHQTLDVSGSTAITPPGGPATVTPIGFLSSGTNSGRFARDRFTVVPEVGVNAGVQVTRNLRAFVGYNFLYSSSVIRPVDQIDLGLSGTQIPTDSRFNPTTGPARPAPLLRDTGFWVQGVSFGAEFRY